MLARLQHPNIVSYIDQGCHDGILYFVMEYCGDGSVNDLMAKSGGRLPVKTAVGLILQALDGLAYAHKLNFVHRDLKPSNILLGRLGLSPFSLVQSPFSCERSGRKMVTVPCMVADFGLAKNFQQAGLSGMTVSGTGGGTLLFVPAEQIIDFKHVNPVSDIFSIGATLYNMLSGDYVYDYKQAEEPVRVILEKKLVPIHKRIPALPARIAQVVDKAIAPEPKDRFQTALEMKAALRGSRG